MRPKKPLIVQHPAHGIGVVTAVLRHTKLYEVRWQSGKTGYVAHEEVTLLCDDDTTDTELTLLQLAMTVASAIVAAYGIWAGLQFLGAWQ